MKIAYFHIVLVLLYLLPQNIIFADIYLFDHDPILEKTRTSITHPDQEFTNSFSNKPFNPLIDITVTPYKSCYGKNNGSAVVTQIDNGTYPFTYSWRYDDYFTVIKEGPDSIITDLAPGNYWIVVTDDDGDYDIKSFTITQTDNIIIIDVSKTDVTCNNNDDGMIDITAFGGFGSLYYSIDSGYSYQASNSFALLAPGDYYIFIKDDYDCSKSYSGNPVTITEPLLITIDHSETHVSCKGGNDGSIDITPLGGTPSYTFAWSHGPTTEDVSGLIAGSYSVIVTDANGCTADSTIDITEPLNAISIDHTDTHVSCNGGNDGSIDITPAGGTPGYTYAWDHGPTTQNVSGLSADSYRVVVTDTKGCTQDSTFSISEPTPIQIDRVITDVKCNGGNNGSIDITPSGSNPPYTFLWSTSATTEDVSVLSAGDYTVTVYDANLCEQDSTFTVSEPPPLTIAHSETHVKCNGFSDGSIDITPAGGTPGYTYAWDHGPTTQDVSGLSAGFYSVTVTDANGCTADSTIEITEPLLITIAHTETHVSCKGGNDGSIDITPSGGTPTYTFSWSHGPTTKDVSGLFAGSYTVEVTDVNGCTADSTIDITEPLNTISIGHTETHVKCNGGNDGSINITPAGGTPGYTYAWDHGPTTQNVSGLSADSYRVVVTDTKGCTQDSTFSISEPTPIQIDRVITDVKCNGGNNGSIDITPSGSNPPYTFLWSTSATTEDVSVLSAGDYTVTVYDANLCTQDSTFTVSEPPPLTIAHSETHVSCNGLSDGSIDITPGGGTLGYSFSWDHGPITEDVSGLSAGFYSVTVTDANGCTADSTIEITEPLLITIAHTETHVSCKGDNDGSIDITPSGGTPVYTFSWSHGPTTKDVSGLFAGSYTVEVTDVNGCTADSTIDITEPDLISITTDSITHVSCFGDSDGAVYITVTGGTSPYGFAWTGPGLFSSSDEDITNLSAGIYNLTLNDANGCNATHGPDTVKQPEWLAINIDSIIHVTCNGDDDGSIGITPSGGTPPYSYAWTGPDSYTSTDEDISNLAPGDYNLVLSDTNGCNLNLGPLTITEPLVLLVTEDSLTDISCYGAKDGAIYVTTRRGTLPYTYSWTGPSGYTSSSDDIKELKPGDYNLTVTDAHGCTDNLGPVTISEPAEIIITTDLITNVSCNGGDNGVIEISVAGGVPGYTYSWIGTGSFASDEQDIDSLFAGIYTLTVTDATLCSVDHGPDTITEPPVLDAILDSSFNITCFGDGDGAIYVTASGGTLPYNYSWSGPESYTAADEDITNLEAGDYNLEITDGNGCKFNLGPVTITEPALLTVTVDSLSDITCFGDTNGAVYVTVTGGISPYDFAWSGPGGYTSTKEDITGLDKGDYDLVVTGSNGCIATIPTQTIDEPPAISVAVDPTSKLALSCYGDTDGKIDITVSGGTAPFTFSWTGPGGYSSSSKDISGLIAGEYNLSIIDVNGCSENYTPLDTITQPALLQVSLTKTDISCFNDNNGTITAIVSGGTRPYEYSKNNFITINPDSSFKNLPPALYTIYVRDANSCQVSDTITIKQPTELRINTEIKDDSNNKCYGDSNATISITAVGGTSPLEFSIDSGYTYSTSNFFSNLPAGNYYVFAKDQNGCIDEGSKLVVGQPAEIIISSYTQLDITSCSYSEEGQIAIEASGGVSPITYTLDGSDNNLTGVFTDVGAGPHLIEITDANACRKDTTIAINSPPPIVVDAVTLTHISGCYGDSTGSIDVTASGGTGALEYSLDGGPYEATTSYSDLPGGNYTVTIKDKNDCTLDTLLIINQPDTISTSSIDVIPVTCKGYTDGSITVAGSGGTAPYTYTLNPGSVSNGTGVFENLTPGTYTMIIDDANGCPSYTTPPILVDEPEQLLIDSVTLVEITCYGMNNGQINIYGSGGYAPFNYSINNGTDYDTTFLFTGLSPTTYYVVIKDSGGCTVQGDTLLLSEPPEIIIDSESAADVATCYGDSTGSVNVSASGGWGSLTYSIDSITWQSSGDFNNLPVGNYTVIASDTAGCSAKSNILTINQPEQITADITMIQSINGEPGSIHISASGGTGNLEYSISGTAGPYQADTAFLSLWPGDYPVVVRDENNCVYEETVTLDAVPLLEIDVSYSMIDCYGQNIGTITLISINGTGIVQYSIDGGTTFFTDGSFTDLPAATYPIYVTDENHRIFKDTVIITEPPPLTVTPTITNATCNRHTYDGSVILSVSGGTPDYTYLWSNDSTTKDITNLEEGSYSVTITDANNCIYQDTFIVAANVSITADAGNDTTVCPGKQVILNGLGGTNYFWQPETGLNNPIIANPVATITEDITYTLTATEPAGCYDIDSVTIGVYPLLGIDAGNDTTVATGQTIQLNVSGGPFETYSWVPQEGLDDPTSPTPSLLVSENMVYHVTGISTYGCSESDSLTITTAGNLIIYSGFTPNGDGINDFWDIDNVIYYPNITVEVYNRWGAQVFSSKGYASEKRWDGTYKGKDVPIGTYYYVIQLNDGSKPITGHVTIVR